MARSRHERQAKVLSDPQGRPHGAQRRAAAMDGRSLNAHKIMAASIEFNLNDAFRLWREQLSQSPHFRPENLDELESHLRDSVTVLQSKGLSADEAFLIGTRRVGKDAALEEQ